MLTNFTSKAAALCAGSFLLVSALVAQTRPYNIIYSGNVKGGTAVIGNTAMHITNTAGTTVQTAQMNQIGNANNGQGGIGSTQYGNDDANMRFIDIDTDATTFSSSSADLILPAGTNTIKFARLYWGGRIQQSAINAVPDTLQRVRIKANNGAYQNITAAVASVDKTSLPNTTEVAYQSYADITNYVQQRGNGTYTIANIPATQGAVSNGGRYAGWSIIIVYENPNSLFNSVRLFDGYNKVEDNSTLNVTLTGLDVPNNSLSASDAVFTVVSWEGDGNLGATNANPAGDFIKVNNITVSDAVNKATNFWNGSISRNGAYVTTKNPSYANQMGIDIDEVFVGAGYGILPNANSVKLTFGTESDAYYPSLFAFQLRVKDPLVTISKTVIDDNQNSVIQPNEEMTYTLTGKNIGPGVANSVFVVDTLPANVTYVAGSMKVIQSPGAVLGNQTDAADAVDYSFKATNSGKTYVKFFLGAGATQNSGGTLQVNETYTVTFKVKAGAVPSGISNTATSYAYSASGDLFTDQSTAVISPSGAPLSVKLVSFTGKLAQPNKALLEWVTNEEVNNKYFILERSEDAVNFEPRATIDGKGTSNQVNKYQYSDEINVSAKVVYYRLKAVDVDGKFSYSAIVPVRLSNSVSIEKVSVYPNPFVNNVKLFVNSKEAGIANFRVFSLDGKTVSNSKIKMEAGDNIIVLQEMNKLQPGTYMIEVTTADAKIIKKLVKL